MFLHIGVLHLICNAWFGFRICAAGGEPDRRPGGSSRFTSAAASSASAVSVIGHDALSAGASGALFGVVGWMLVTLLMRAGSLRAFTQNPAIRQQLIWIGAWFVLGAFIGFDNYAHGGGMLFGGLYAWALAAEPRQEAALAPGGGVLGRRAAGVRVAAPAALGAPGRRPKSCRRQSRRATDGARSLRVGSGELCSPRTIAAGTREGPHLIRGMSRRMADERFTSKRW